MTLSQAVFTFINAWWITLLFLLPFGVTAQPPASALDYVAAPRPHRWRRLFAVNTCLALLCTLALALVIKSGIFSFGSGI